MSELSASAVAPSHGRIAVIGGGIAGIASARALRSAGYEVTIFERSNRLGGRLRQVDVPSGSVDVGAQFVAGFYSDLLTEIRSAGLGHCLQPRSQSAAIVYGDAAWPVQSARDLLLSGLLSPLGRLRLVGLLVPVGMAWLRVSERDLATSAEFDDESVSDFVERWAGSEALERLIAPVLRGLLYWDAATTSKAVLLTMIKAALSGRDAYRFATTARPIVDGLAASLEVRTSSEITAVEALPTARVLVSGRTGQDEWESLFDGVVCATTASVAVNIVQGLSASGIDFLRRVTYSGTAVLTYQVSIDEFSDRTLMFASSSSEFLGAVATVPGPAVANGLRLVNVFLSDAGYSSFAGLADEALLDQVRAHVAESVPDAAWFLEARGCSVWRWHEALPRFDVGYLREAHLQSPKLLDVGPIMFAGDYLQAPHLEGAYSSGVKASKRLNGFLTARVDG